MWLRLQRSGNQFTGYGSYDGQAWQQLGTASLTLTNPVYFGMAVASHSSTQDAVVQFRDFANVTNAPLAIQSVPFEPLGPSSRKTPIAITEIMYKPAPRTDSNNLEFIEIYNSNPYFHDISGYRLVANNLSYTFPANTILPGGAFRVIAASPQSIRNVYGINNVVGPYQVLEAARRQGVPRVVLASTGQVIDGHIRDGHYPVTPTTTPSSSWRAPPTPLPHGSGCRTGPSTPSASYV